MNLLRIKYTIGRRIPCERNDKNIRNSEILGSLSAVIIDDIIVTKKGKVNDKNKENNKKALTVERP